MAENSRIKILSLCFLQILDNCPEICWHYIGHLQRNKVNKIAGTSYFTCELDRTLMFFEQD